MKRISLLLLSMFLYFLLACKKDGSNTGNHDGCKIVRVDYTSDVHGTSSSYISYDSQNRVIRVDEGIKQSSIFRTYKYESDKITVSATEGSNSGVIRIYTLQNGHVIKGASENGNWVFFYGYDNAGRLISADLTSINKGYVSSLSWDTNNITAMDNVSVEYINSPLEIFELAHPLFLSGQILEDDSDPFLLMGGYFGKNPLNIPFRIGNETFNYVKDSDGAIISMQSDSWEMNVYRDCN
ncbi:MAG: DUF4595 domain-containing protein [Parapedobacter sp.]|nr:MAG: DUF4595 domain-containing protein [Parapedobacter sp.]